MLRLAHLSKVNYKEAVFFLLLVFLAHKVVFSIDKATDFYFKKEDIYYEYAAAKQMQEGENPYVRILEGDMLANDKYATQLPHYYRTIQLIRNYSEDNFSGFIESFRFVLYCAQVTGGIFIYQIFKREKKHLLGIAASVFFVFNVWTLSSIIYLKQDLIAICLLIMAFYFLDNKKYNFLSYILYGFSLGMKYIGVFAFPIFILTSIKNKQDTKKLLINLMLMLTVLVAPSVKFMYEDFSSFSKSIMFSVTRSPSSSDIPFGYSGLLVEKPETYRDAAVFDKLLPRLPLAISILVVLVLLFSKKIDKPTYLFLSLLVFSIFNPVIFPQYITWIPPFALFPLLKTKSL